MKSLTYIEMDVDHCSLTYGISPCTAFLARHNLFLRSEDFSQSEWVKTAVNVTTEAGDPPPSVLAQGAGGSNMDLIVPTTANTEHYVSQDTAAIAAGVTEVTISIYAKASGYAGIAIEGRQSAALIGRHRYNISNGRAINESGVGTVRTQYVGNGTYRIASTFSVEVGAAFQARIIILPTEITTPTSYAGDGTSGIMLWGAQVTRSAGMGVYTRTDDTVVDGGEEVDDLCFNSLGTCQDRANFTNAPVTLRYVRDTLYRPEDIRANASLANIAYRSTVISLGEDLGVRPSLKAAFRDHPWPDTPPSEYDKYVRERSYDPNSRGTYWGKFRPRNPYMRGRPLRWIDGTLGQSLAEMTTRHFTIDEFSGPDVDGVYQVTAKDPLKLADAVRAQAPEISNGFLLASINDTDTSATLAPSGIGSEYPTSGLLNIGGEEIVSFTRSGDTLTITRAQEGTTATDHDAEDRVQVVLKYSGETAAYIINDLLTNYAGVPSSYINLPLWEQEVLTYIGTVYTRTIPEPTSVRTLINDMIKQASLAVWWDDIGQAIKLQVLRSIDTSADLFTENDIEKGSMRVKEQPELRKSQVWVFFGQRNPLEDVDDEDNYRSAAVTIDAATELDYGEPAIEKIFATYIPSFARQVALTLGGIRIARFKIPPREFQFTIPTRGQKSAVLGGGYNIRSWNLQDATGALEDTPIQVTSLIPGPARSVVTAQGMDFDTPDVDLLNRVIIIDSNSFNLDIKTIHDTIYPELTDEDVYNYVNLTVIIEAGVIVGSNTSGVPALDIGIGWPTDFPITLDIRGRIQGLAGRGGNVTSQSSQRTGVNGETALYTRFPIGLDDGSGEIWGGAGGGGATYTNGKDFSGGGGAGAQPGEAGTGGQGGSVPAEPGTTEAGGQGNEGFDGDGHYAGGGDGGDPGEAGTLGFLGGASGTRYSPGSAGNAIDGISYITTVSGPGDRRGPTVN